jgi:hypothetical protein
VADCKSDAAPFRRTDYQFSGPLRAGTALPRDGAIAKAGQGRAGVLARAEAFAQAATVAMPKLISGIAGHARQIDQQARIAAAVGAPCAMRNLRRVCAHAFSFRGTMQPGECKAACVSANLPQG